MGGGGGGGEGVALSDGLMLRLPEGLMLRLALVLSLALGLSEVLGDLLWLGLLLALGEMSASLYCRQVDSRPWSRMLCSPASLLAGRAGAAGKPGVQAQAPLRLALVVGLPVKCHVRCLHDDALAQPSAD